jgi:hypothetical protein
MNWSDLDTAADESRKPAPDGTYTMVVKKATESQTKQKDPMLNLLCEVAEGPYKGKSCFERLAFSPNGAAMAKDKLAILGFKSIADWGHSERRLDILVGRKFEAELVIGEWQGSKRNEIKRMVRGIAGDAIAGLTPPPVDGATKAPAAPTNPLNV